MEEDEEEVDEEDEENEEEEEEGEVRVRGFVTSRPWEERTTIPTRATTFERDISSGPHGPNNTQATWYDQSVERFPFSDRIG